MVEFLTPPKPLLFRGGAARLGLAQQGLVAAGWGFEAPHHTNKPHPNPSPKREGLKEAN